MHLTHSPVVDDGIVVIETTDGPIEVGELSEILELLGGPSWTITYSEWERRRYPDLDTADEGITLDVVDVINAMALDREFVDEIATLPAEPTAAGAVSPRLGLFVGRLLENLANGLS